MIISVHVPKCAGTTFRKLLDSAYEGRIWHNYGTIFSKDKAQAGVVPANSEIIHGHFIADSFDDLYPARSLITWVRHPVERLVSNYHHFLRTPDMRDDCARAVHEQKLTLLQFSDLDWMRNMTCRYLANKPLSEFEFVGVAERFDESMHVFRQLFGLKGQIRIPRENANPSRRGERYDLSPDDFAYILDRNSADLAFYEAANYRLSFVSGAGIGGRADDGNFAADEAAWAAVGRAMLKKTEPEDGQTETEPVRP